MGEGSDGDPLSSSCHQWSWPGGKVPRYQSSAESNFLMMMAMMMMVVVMVKNVNMMMMIDNWPGGPGSSSYSSQWFNC